MSDPASKAATHFLQFRIQYSSIALLYYDYALTFPAEVKHIWYSKFRVSTILYVFCRYALVANILYLLAIAGKLGEGLGRDHVFKFITAISILGRFAVIATFTARTYAVYGRDWRVLALLGTVGTFCVACDITSSVDDPKVEIAGTILSISMCVFEGLSAVLTAARSIQMLQSRGRWLDQKGSFAFLVFKQSLLYFSLVSIFTTAAAVLNFHAEKGSFFQRLPNALTLPVSCLMTARFLLGLRKWEANKVRGSGNNVAVQTMSGFQAAGGVDHDSSSGGPISTLFSDFGDDVRAADSGLFHVEMAGKGKTKMRSFDATERSSHWSHSSDEYRTADEMTSSGTGAEDRGGLAVNKNLVGTV